MNFYYDIAEIRGRIAEQKVEEVLEILKKEEKIKDYGKTIPFSKEDRNGIDFFIYPYNRKEIKLQIKAGGCLKIEAIEKYQKEKIFVIKNVLKKSEEEIKKEILDIINSSF